MRLIRSFEQDNFTPVGFGLRVMIVALGGGIGEMSQRVAGLGGQVEDFDELFTGLSHLIDDPYGYGLCVVDCDAFGGLDLVRRACQRLSDEAARVPVMLISRDCKTQIFPNDRHLPVVLRAPVSAVSFRVGFEHALRDRLALRVT